MVLGQENQTRNFSVRYASAFEGVYKDRQYACSADYYGTMGIERSDKAARQELMLKNWQFFGAPHVAFLSMPKSMGPVNALSETTTFIS